MPGFFYGVLQYYVVISDVVIRVVYRIGIFGRYWSVFLGIYHTDTDEKLGQYISVSKRGQWPPFFLKRRQWPPF